MSDFVLETSTNEWDILPKQKQQHKHKQTDDARANKISEKRAHPSVQSCVKFSQPLSDA